MSTESNTLCPTCNGPKDNKQAKDSDNPVASCNDPFHKPQTDEYIESSLWHVCAVCGCTFTLHVHTVCPECFAWPQMAQQLHRY